MHFQCWKSTRRRDKKFILWTLFSVQLLLIGIFVLFGTSNNNPSNDIDDDSIQSYRSIDLPNAKSQKSVKFVKHDISLKLPTTLPSNLLLFSSPEKFHHAYFECSSGNATDFTSDALFCFRNTSILPVSADLRKFVDSADEDEEDCMCKCQDGYHGRDCSQPEVIWRAFMTVHLTKQIDDMNLSNQNEPKPRRIYYLIDSSALSLTTVEIQFMELHDLIDLLILCDEVKNDTHAIHTVSSRHERFRYHQTSSEHNSNFFLKKMKRKILILETKQKCTPKIMYKMFRKYMNMWQNRDPTIDFSTNDIFLFSSYDEILSRQAIQYIKWNNGWLQAQPIRFRLKYTVYGFYWQHPMQTTLSSAACQLHVLDELYNSDPNVLLNVTNTGMIIGDLNHYGGWFCRYCYETTENIAQKIQRDRMLNLHLLNTNHNRNELNSNDVHQEQQPNKYDSASIEAFISAGVYIDGKIDLLRLHRYSDKYYAPNSVADNSWKYEQLLTNTYAHYDGDTDE